MSLFKLVSHKFSRYEFFPQKKNLTLCFSEYVNLYLDYLLNKSIYQQFASFYHGFHSVCASNALIVSIIPNGLSIENFHVDLS